MGSHRMGETGLSESRPSNHHQVAYGLFHGNCTPLSLMNQGSSAFGYGGELGEAIALQEFKFRNDEVKAALFTSSSGAAATTTLEMFPSKPMTFPQAPGVGNSKSGEESTDSGSAMNTTISSKTEAQFESESPMSRKSSSSNQHYLQLQQQPQEMASNNTSGTGPSQNLSAAKSPQEKRKGAGSTSGKQLDAKTLRRLAQNREAARKSRLRKKAYVQQLESSRMKLTQLEQELQRARSQGLFLGCGGAAGSQSSGAAIFDMEYARWLEDDQRHMLELRAGLQAPLSDGELRAMVDGYLSHYDEIFRLKGMAAKSDVFHLITGMWITPAERCFNWMGGFRPSELIVMLTQQLEPLAEQQIMGMHGLRYSSQQAEEALTQGLEQLHQSLVDTIAGGPVVDGVQQMVVAMGKLANLEGFVRQADNLRQQTLHQFCRLLTVRQAARCFLVIGEYYARLRALSSLWSSRPRETFMGDEGSCQTAITDLHMVQASQNHHHQQHFSNF